MTDLHDYLLDRVLEDARSDATQIPSDVCDSLTQVPTIDKLRERVDIEHFGDIRILCEEDSASHQKLGLALLRGIDEEKKVRNYVKEWATQSNLSFETRVGLTFELAQLDELDDSLRRKSFDFIRENWSKWVENQRKWAGGENGILGFSRQRLSSKSIPANKRWLYLCTAAVSDQTEEARELIGEYLEDPDPFVRDVAEAMLNRL